MWEEIVKAIPWDQVGYGLGVAVALGVAWVTAKAKKLIEKKTDGANEQHLKDLLTRATTIILNVADGVLADTSAEMREASSDGRITKAEFDHLVTVAKDRASFVLQGSLRGRLNTALDGSDSVDVWIEDLVKRRVADYRLPRDW